MQAGGEGGSSQVPVASTVSLWVYPGDSQTQAQERPHPRKARVFCPDLKSPGVESRNLKPGCSGGGQPSTLKLDCHLGNKNGTRSADSLLVDRQSHPAYAPTLTHS